VLDNSVTLAWLFNGELAAATQQVFDRVVADEAWVPSKQCGMLNPHLAKADTMTSFAAVPL
jgi:hypothetical protein